MIRILPATIFIATASTAAFLLIDYCVPELTATWQVSDIDQNIVTCTRETDPTKTKTINIDPATASHLTPGDDCPSEAGA